MESDNIIPKEKEKINQIKSKNKLNNIKSKYILQKVFNNLKMIKLLYIIKYNKNIMERININIKDYKEWSEQYSSIEIEIKPANKKYGKFINIDKGNEIYYHIYFDNITKEINRKYINKDEEIEMIKIIINFQIESFQGLFDNCKCIKSIDFKKFNRNNITNMSFMFYECSSLKKLNINNFITNNVTNMFSMFYECSSLKELNLSNLNTLIK